MRNILKKLLLDSITKFKDNDRELLTFGHRGVGERTICHRVAYYLENLIREDKYKVKISEDIVVDCEYNKIGFKSKIPRKKLMEELLGEEYTGIKAFREVPSNYHWVAPDIIIHERNRSENNLLVIEIKKSTASKYHIARDRARLRYFTHPGGEYKYLLGALIIMNLTSNEPDVLWFRYGICE